MLGLKWRRNLGTGRAQRQVVLPFENSPKVESDAFATEVQEATAERFRSHQTRFRAG